jgi:kynurenine formamidase
MKTSVLLLVGLLLGVRSISPRAIAKAHKIAIECTAHLGQLPPTGATLVLGPLRLQNGSGSPLSVMAFVP